MFNISVVNIIPDAHKDAINQIAALYDCGMVQPYTNTCLYYPTIILI